MMTVQTQPDIDLLEPPLSIVLPTPTAFRQGLNSEMGSNFSWDEINQLTTIFSLPTEPTETLSIETLPEATFSPLMNDWLEYTPINALIPTPKTKQFHEIIELPPSANTTANTKTKCTEVKTARKRAVKTCEVEGCENRARSRGKCKKHGGGKRCIAEGCFRPAQCKGLCPRHGGASRCKVEGCQKFSQSRGLCKQHGGGTLCAHEGCRKNAHQNRFCRAHGGGLKCKFVGCTKWAQRSGFCCSHTKSSKHVAEISLTMGNEKLIKAGNSLSVIVSGPLPEM